MIALETMKNLNLSLALLLALSALSSLPALAENEQKDLTGRITSTGFDPYQKVIATSNNVEVSRNVSANACGFVKITPTESYPVEDEDDIEINGVSHDFGQLSIGPAPKCTNGAISNLDAISSLGNAWKDSEDNIYVRGLTAYVPYKVVYDDLNGQKTLTANACGHIVLPADFAGETEIYASEANLANGVVLAVIDGSGLTPGQGSPICRNGISFIRE